MASGTLTINLDVIIGNYQRAVRSCGEAQRQFVTQPPEVGVVLKCNAYGFGVERVAPALRRAGCATFFVVTLEEGIHLRLVLADDRDSDAGRAEAVVVILGGVDGKRAADYVTHRLTPAVASLQQLAQVQHAARLSTTGRRQQKQTPTANGDGVRREGAAQEDEAVLPSLFPVYLQLDTGINRLGLDLAGVDALVANASAFRDRMEGLRVACIMSHLSSADCAGGAVPSAQQMARFVEACDRIDAVHMLAAPVPKPAPFRRSFANSAAVFRPEYSAFHFDLVRPGMALFGLDPLDPAATAAGRSRTQEKQRCNPDAADASASESTEEPWHPLLQCIEPAVLQCIEVTAPVAQVRHAAQGEGIGYGGTFTATRPDGIAIAVIRAGYGDGLPYAMGNKGALYWNPHCHQTTAGAYRLPVIGAVSMDSVTVDISDVPPSLRPREGDAIEILGVNQSADDIAATCGSIGHEILTGLGDRFRRVYVEAGQASESLTLSTSGAGTSTSASSYPIATALSSTSSTSSRDGDAIAATTRPHRLPAPPPEITPQAGAYIYAMTAFLHQELKKLNIRYYLEGGSLLGQVRDGGIIRYDDDADIQIHPHDGARLVANVDAVRRSLHMWCQATGEKMTLRQASFGYKLILEPRDPQSAWELHFDTLGGTWAPGFAIVDLFLTELGAEVDGEVAILYTDPVICAQVAKRGYGDILYRRLGTLPVRAFGPIFARVAEDAVGAAHDVFGTACLNTVENKDGSTFKHDGGVRLHHDHELFLGLVAQIDPAMQQ